MVAERQIQELIARYVAIAVYYHNCGDTSKRAAEFQAVAAEVKGWRFSRTETEERILGPVEAEISARYGGAEGRRIHAEVIKGFRGSEMHVLCTVLK